MGTERDIAGKDDFLWQRLNLSWRYVHSLKTDKYLQTVWRGGYMSNMAASIIHWVWMDLKKNPWLTSGIKSSLAPIRLYVYKDGNILAGLKK